MNGVIDHGIISFSNAFGHRSHTGNATRDTIGYSDRRSYAIFGGINATQIVGGEEGLVSMKLARGKMNHMNMWAAKARGFAYGKTVIYSPELDKPYLGTIDSGTTLIIIPTMIFENLVNVMAESFKDKN